MQTLRLPPPRLNDYLLGLCANSWGASETKTEQTWTATP